MPSSNNTTRAADWPLVILRHTWFWLWRLALPLMPWALIYFALEARESGMFYPRPLVIALGIATLFLGWLLWLPLLLALAAAMRMPRWVQLVFAAIALIPIIGLIRTLIAALGMVI